VNLDTLVLGAGISGLACAHARMRAGREVLVLEAADRAGGRVRTVAAEGHRFEEGPEALPAGARQVRDLCRELGLAVNDAPAEAARRFLWSEGKLLELPSSAEDLSTSRVLPFGAKLRLLAEASCARDTALDGSIAEFALHRFGSEALERVVEPLVAGIHAGAPEALSLRACFPDVVRMVEEHGSVTAALKARAQAKKATGLGVAPKPVRSPLFKPAEGMEALCAALARALGPRLRLQSAVSALERTGEGWRVHLDSGTSHAAANVVLALPLRAARALLAGVAPAAAAALASMPAEDLAAVVHVHRRADVAHALDGSGYLVPRSAGGFVLGTLFSSTIDPAAAPAGHVLLRTLLGGARRPEALALDDAELAARTHAECAGPLGLARPPVFTWVGRYPAAIPRFDLGHLERRATLQRDLPAGIAVLGDFTRGLGLEVLVAEAQATAQRLAASGQSQSQS
jgi:oxygen-dependent protoporphyrinogen oxidase